MSPADESADLTSGPRLIVITGRPGTGKTTLSKALAGRLGCCYLRIDAVETALQVAVADFGIGDLGPDDLGSVDLSDIGPAGYVVVHRLAASNLGLGQDVVVDAVCPVPESRQGWAATATATNARLIIFETVLSDTAEHRRRVTERRPDMPGQRVPSWDQVAAGQWVPWDVDRDGDRQLVDTADLAAAVSAALATITAPT